MPATNETHTPATDEPHEDDVSDVGEHELYPQPASRTNCAKDYDDALLQDCTVSRMRLIARAYADVDSKGVKSVLFRALYDAMNDDQECPQCHDGKCIPDSHMFLGISAAPAGWIKGPDGKYAPPQHNP